ncbi:MAG TPA: hypothetical protein DCE56_09300, partial [Cyanobacteria bacterium UBA8553]|nr:hypothetical protein [Cyanobacteria bacterium UBA8553]
MWKMIRGNYKEFLRKQLPDSLINFEVLDANIQAKKDYVAPVYLGLATLFSCQVKEPKYCHDPQFGWGSFVGGELKIHEVPGDHYGMLREP